MLLTLSWSDLCLSLQVDIDEDTEYEEDEEPPEGEDGEFLRLIFKKIKVRI